MWRILRRSLLVLVILYIVYFFCTAWIPYLRSRPVSQSYKEAHTADSFYGDGVSVDRVVLVEEGMSSLDARVRICAEAQSTLDVSYYAIHQGTATDIFLASLLDAADRGVQVRILTDGGAGDLKRNAPLAAALGTHPNIEMKLYNKPSLLKPWTLNGRMHDKYIIADDKLLLLGGRNVGDRFFGPEDFTGELSLDRDVLVYNTVFDRDDRSSVLFSVRDYMDTIWNGEDVTPFGHKELDGDDAYQVQAYREILHTLYREMIRVRPQLIARELDWQELTLPTAKVTLVANPVEIGAKAPQVGYVLRELIQNAEESVLLQSPYVVLSPHMRAAMEELGGRGLDSRVLTNSMAASPNLPAFSLYLKDRQDLLDSGLRIFEFQDRNAIHAKTYIIDHRMCLVGSFNLDPRSEAVDTELLLAIDSPGFAAQMEAVEEQYLEHSLEVDPDGGYLPSDDLPPQEESRFKRILFHVLGFLLSPFRSLV